MIEDKIKNAELNYEKDLQNWEKAKKEAASSVLSGCGCLLVLPIIVGLYLTGFKVYGSYGIGIGLVLLLILSRIDEYRSKKSLKEFLDKNPKPSFKSPLTGDGYTIDHQKLPPGANISPVLETDEIILEAAESDFENEQLSISPESEFTDKRVETTLQKVRDFKTKSRKRIELKKLHGYVYDKIEDIENKCGFIDDPGASPSIYEGLIDWEDAAGFENDQHRDPWFYYMEVIEKVESSIDKFDNSLTGNKVFDMLQDLTHISIGKSIRSSISKDAMSLIIEQSLNEIEGELVERYERSYNNPNTGSDITLVFNLHSNSKNLTHLLIVDHENPREEFDTIPVEQFHDNLYSKAGYAVSTYYSQS